MSLKSFYVIFALIFVCGSAQGWQSGKTETYPMNCQGLKKNGADYLYLKITAESGSYGIPYLVGRKGDTDLWSQRFPADKVNLAKFGCSCKGNTITLSHADPGPNSYKHQTFVWNGRFVEKLVKFEKGSNNWSVLKETSKDQRDRFRFWARKGQKIRVEMRNKAPSIFEIFEPESKTPLQTLEFGEQTTTWSDVLKKTGDYIMVIKGTSDDSRYYVRLWID